MSKKILPLAIVCSLFSCKNEAYEKCIEGEKQALEKLKTALDACDKLPDATKQDECRKQAQSGHFEAGCEALK